MSVITVSREFGSQGSIIAEQAAQRLGYHLAGKDMIEAILRDYGLSSLKDEYESIPGFWDRFSPQKRDQRNNILGMLNDSICALAQHGDVVILGRGGFAILQGYVDVLNVRVQAPLALRIKRVEELPAIGEASRAEEVVKANDRLQDEFIKSVYGADWGSATPFDLVIDTGKIGPDPAAWMIAECARALEPAGDADGPATADLRVDSILAAVVKDVLNPVGAHAG